MGTNQKTKNVTEVTIDFGNKKVRKHGEYTRVIALDKKALQACGCPDGNIVMARVELIKTPDQGFLKVTPFCDKVPQDDKIDNGIEENV